MAPDDPCVFLSGNPELPTLVIVAYVDDLIVTGHSEHVASFLAAL
jgi:hypothetical protein